VHLSPVVNFAWQLACVEAISARRQTVEPEHFLAALTKLRHVSVEQVAEEVQLNRDDLPRVQFELSLTAELFQSAGVDPDNFRRELRERLGVGSYDHQQGGQILRSPRSHGLLDRAEAAAREMKLGDLNCGHILIALLEETHGPGCRLMAEKGIDLETLARTTREQLDQLRAQQPAGRDKSPKAEAGKSATPFLDAFGTNLTEQARSGKLGPVIGRRQEILQVIRTLARQSKNNPVLVGKAGVGKTAIVEAIACRIIQGKDKQVLDGKRIVSLNMGVLVSGAKYRGEFEQRLAGIIDECSANKDVLLFIDELHTLIGAGRAEGSMDAANILKPALSRGDMRCIGATTFDEYRRYVESDSALERRFEKILVPEPSRDETLEILRGRRAKLEEHHGISINDTGLEAAVDLSIRFDVNHQLPDKALDLLDLAGARMQIPALSFRLEPDDSHSGQLDSFLIEPPGEGITERVIARVLSEKLGVPEDILTGHLEGLSQSRWQEMSRFLKDRIIGQDDAIDCVCRRLLLAQAGLNERRGPLGVFLFLGPTGVGKTELARSLSLFLFGSERDMIRLDMSEYMEQHSVARMVGAPPGYIGHEEEGQLTGQLRSKPYTVVLLDEIEKAHARVFDLFLQVFDDGRLTDSKGRTADARHALFIMTSNIPATTNLGFRQKHESEPQQSLSGEVEKCFRPEFLNRIDERIVFRTLDLEDVRIILRQRLAEIDSISFKKYHKPVCFTDAAVDMIVTRGYSREHGVRNLHRVVERLVEAPLAELVAAGRANTWPNIEVDVKDESLTFQPGGRTL